MAHPKDDRRTRRTHQLLRDALVELMMEKRFDDITVQDILDRADIGRSTFYTHYTDKESLLISTIEHMIHELEAYTAQIGNPHHGLLPSLELFRHVQGHRRLMQAFVWGKSAELYTQGLLHKTSALIEYNLRSMMSGDHRLDVPLPVIANYVAGTFLMLLRWWFDEDMRHTPEQMDVMFQQLVMPTIEKLIH